MCHLCGCQEYISQGEEAILARAAELVRELGLTHKNVPLFEDVEFISALLGPRMPLAPEDEEVWQMVEWVYRLHLTWAKDKYPKAVASARDVFRRVPTKRNLKEAITLYHQLEQLNRHISDDMLGSMDPALRATLEAERHLHDNIKPRMAEIVRYYGLEQEAF